MMKYLMTTSLLVIIAGHAVADNYTTLKPYGNYYQPYVYDNVDVVQVDVINRQSRLYPDRQPQKDPAAPLVVAEYQKVLSTIPLTPRKEVAPLRKFQFKSNTPPYVAAQRQQSATVQQTQTVTQTLNAVIQQNIVVQDGNVLLDVPPQIINRLTSTGR